MSTLTLKHLLGIGETGQTVYTVIHAGEAFGWSSLIDRDVYTASAECIEPTSLMKIDEEKLLKIIEEDPTNGLILFKQLAVMLGNRLLQNCLLNRFKISYPSVNENRYLQVMEVRETLIKRALKIKD